MTFRGLVLLSLCVAARPAGAQTPTAQTPPGAAATMEAARTAPGMLVAFLREMPKGADLHTHLLGAIYAESFIAWGAESGACIHTTTMVAGPPPCDSANGTVPLSNALRDQDFYDVIVDAWSMRNLHPARENGHEQFFDSFDKFGYAGQGRRGEMLAEAASRAAANRVSYVEMMDTPDDGAIGLGLRTGWDPDFARMRDKLRAAGHAQVVTAARRYYADMVTKQRAHMRCGTANAANGCAVEIRFLYQVLRGLPPEAVYAQILTAFEAASSDSLVVGFNLVMPEDGYVAMRDFSMHMRAIDYLHGLYPKVKISLHAGELVPGLVPPEGLRFHIRESILKGHASRIGHGTAIMYEDSAFQTLELMAKRGIALESSLSSAQGILNIQGPAHPMKIYNMHSVPIVLATDDEGVSRTEMTHEYFKAATEQGLDYVTLKKLAHNSIEYSFVQEAVKARLRAQLEKDFAAFEAKWGPKAE